jgi:hypothetical protein
VGKLNNLRLVAMKAKNLLAKNDDKVKQAIDKAAGVVDTKTKGKYSQKITGAAAKAKDAVDKIPDEPGARPRPPTQQPPPAEQPPSAQPPSTDPPSRS